MRLAGAMIRVLAEDDDLRVCERGQMQRVENIMHVGIDRTAAVFLRQPASQLAVIRLLHLLPDKRLPVVAERHGHLTSPSVESKID